MNVICERCGRTVRESTAAWDGMRWLCWPCRREVAEAVRQTGTVAAYVAEQRKRAKK